MICKIADGVYAQEVGYNGIKLLHECYEGEWMYSLTLRENEEGPLYWCAQCGITIDNGEAMAIRLFEAPF